ncbi:hypothetical protein [Pseudomonas sp. RIT357]|uniref:hypothetical protein n=1 Tax=Pseudomonas sp. RIT357 TaxID=1470593 RepID=UPI00044BFB45|nr:hypothetical protein [Pseudomonas sp. RIT357]EZP64830.1 hypothetical protein BW43_03678 [Pseudomonas sp. RIT357]
MGYVNLEGATIFGNGGAGILIVGDGTVEATGAFISGNAGGGVVYRQHSPIDELAGQCRTDAKELAVLLKILLSLPEEERHAAAEKDELTSKIKSFGLDGSTFINNIVSLATNPQVTQWIQWLS